MGRVGIVGVADHQHWVCGAPIPRPGVSIGRARGPAGAPDRRPGPPRADGARAVVGEAIQRAEAGRPRSARTLKLASGVCEGRKVRGGFVAPGADRGGMCCDGR
jgi:hypothetical protein